MTQACRASALATADAPMRERIVRGAALEIARMDMAAPPILVGWRVQRLIHRLTGQLDIYKEMKDVANALALAVLPEIRRRVAASRAPLEAALAVAAAANAIDAGIPSSGDTGDGSSCAALLAAVDRPLDGPVGDLVAHAAAARRIVYIADNAGEIVFDRLAIELLGAAKTTLVVRGGPILNDATREDAALAGLVPLVTTIDTGCDIPGVVLERCSPECRRALDAADLIVAKGQGNFESLDDAPLRAPIFFLLKVKCPVVAAATGAVEGSLIVRRGDRTRARSRHDTPFNGARPGAAYHPNCVVCGSANPRGLDLRFTPLADGSVVADVPCEPALEGYPGMLHGGIVSAVLDGAMANCLFHAGITGHTGRLSVRFRQPVEAGRPATVSARLARSRQRAAELSAELTQDGRTKASASAVFMLEGPRN
jgi:hypothetical protein